MSYLVLARKWRPQIFDDLVGQDHIGKTLEKAIATGRVHHAFLFTGTRGVGKTTSARLLAMALNCEKGPTTKPCGVCSSCKQIKSGSGLDVMEIDGASNRGIDDIRELRDQIAYTPAGGKFRIVIIDEVHMLTKDAFNALLKSLEEPPPNFIFIFATTEPHKVPETILSRIQRYDFRKISVSDILKRLEYICNEEKIPFEEPALRLVAQKANGSMRDALTLLDQVIPFCKDKITLSELKPVLGMAGQELFLSLFESILNRDTKSLIEGCAKIITEGIDINDIVSGMSEHTRNLIVAKIPDLTQSLLLLSDEEHKACVKQAALFDTADLLRIADQLSQLSTRLARSQFPRVEFEATLVKLSRLDKSIDIAQLLNGTASISTPATQPAQQISKANKSIAATSIAEKSITEDIPISGSFLGIEPDQIITEWKKIVAKITADINYIGAHLYLSNITHADAEKIDITLPPEQKFQYAQLSNSDTAKKLDDWFSKNLGYKGKISILLTKEGNKPIQQQTAKQATVIIKPTRKSINDAIEKEPIIGSALDVFDGEVI